MAKVGVKVNGVKEWTLWFLGSPITSATAALCVVAFGSHAVLQPERFPPVGGVSFYQLGLTGQPPAVTAEVILPEELGVDQAELQAGVREQAQEAAAAAKPYVVEAAEQVFGEHKHLIAVLNGAAAGIAFLVMLATFAIQGRFIGRKG